MLPSEEKRTKRINALDQLKSNHKQKKAKMADKDEKVSRAQKEREYYINKINDFGKTLAKLDESDLHDLKLKLARAEALLASFETKCVELNAIDEEANTCMQDNEIDAQCEAYKSKIASKIERLMQEKHNAQILEMANAARANEVQPITNTWGEFNGDLYNWRKFKGQFKEKIHDNDQLSENEKLEHLLNACKAMAFDIVVIAKNDYAKAWARLNDFFGESYAQLQYCIHRLTNIPIIDNASIQKLRSLVNIGNHCEEVLKEEMQQTVFDPIISVILASKLDAQMVHAWNRHRLALATSWATTGETQKKATSHIPSWDDLRKFLLSEIELFIKSGMQQTMMNMRDQPSTSRAYMSTPTNQCDSNDGQKDNPKQSHAIQKSQAPPHMQCALCDEIHIAYNCQVYKEKSYENKWSYVKENNLCHRCLHTYHGNSNCDNKLCNEKCPKCYTYDKHTPHFLYHNSTLCPTRYGLHPSKAYAQEDR